MGWDIGQLFNGIGQKLGQFGHFVGDELGLNQNYGKVGPQTIDTTNYNQDRGNQNDLMAMYKAQAAGTGPSMAQGLLQQATDQNINQAMALGAAQQGQGMGYAGALRNIADQSAQARQQGAGQAALLKNQEMLQGQNQLGGLLGTMAGQDLGLAGAQANLNATTDMYNSGVQTGNRDRLGNLIGGVGQGIASIASGGGRPPAPGMAHGGQVAAYVRRDGVHESGYTRRGTDSPFNDIVPAMLSPGEIVLPRSVAQSPDAGARAAEFVSEVRGGGGPSTGPGAHLSKISALEKRIAALERKKRKAA